MQITILERMQKLETTVELGFKQVTSDIAELSGYISDQLSKNEKERRLTSDNLSTLKESHEKLKRDAIQVTGYKSAFLYGGITVLIFLLALNIITTTEVAQVLAIFK